MAHDLTAVTVVQDVSAPSMFTMRLIDWDMAELKMIWVDDPLFTPGNEVEILMGYVDALESVMVGEITGLEPEIDAEHTPMLTIRGYDRLHRLMRGRKTRSFLDQKDSDIVKQVAGEAGLTARVEDTGVVHGYLLQHNQSDWEFLQDRAQRIGYELYVEGRDLRFRPPSKEPDGELVLDRGQDLIALNPRLSMVGLSGALEVRGWDPAQKTAISAICERASGNMGGSEIGPAASDDAFGAAETARVDLPVASAEEAQRIADGRFETMALAYIRGDGLCAGRADLRAGTNIRIEGIGERFSGIYYVTSATHSFDSQTGYRTAFSVRRNAT
jgi:phage protein D